LGIEIAFGSIYPSIMLQFTRNIHFTKLVKVADRLREFNFRKVTGVNDHLFHIDVADERGNRIMFKMQKEQDDNWRILDEQIPQWISATESKLNEVISEEETHY